ncbi:MAG: prolipoprotein diacylglyceryl transferase [Ilumatobacteraceae bacterium]
MPFLASIPSPSSGALHLGPLQLRAYGLMIALGVLAAVWMFGRRLEERGIGTRDDASSIAMWGVGAGIIGARLYHVVTSWESRYSNPLEMLAIWKGGLGVPGGLAAGIAFGVWQAKRRGLPVGLTVTCAAPAIPLAQAIGRWGNWWNQELFGRPTSLPWALKVSERTAIEAGYLPGTTFHPTFLYESLGNFVVVGLLLLIDRRARLRPGALMAVYLAGYAALRFFVESLRIDPANTIGGLRVNTWVSLIVFAGAAGYLITGGRARTDEESARLLSVEERDARARAAEAEAFTPAEEDAVAAPLVDDPFAFDVFDVESDEEVD